ncbi:MAG: lytic transglycosylase domain-containing protein [Nitrospirota bacterium]
MVGREHRVMVSPLHPSPWRMDLHATGPSAFPHSYRVFLRRSDRWDPHRLAVMALPMVLAVLFAGLGSVLEHEAPGARESIPHQSYCCVSRAPETASADDDALPPRVEASTAFRVVYSKQESRALEVARVLEALSPELDGSKRRRLGMLLTDLSSHYGYDPALIVAVIMTESSFDPTSRSHRGAVGLMQLLPNTAESLAEETHRPWFGEHALLDPTFNISLGVRYLAKLHKRFGSLEIALAAYNYGPSRVDEMLRRGSPVPMDYTQRVLAHYEQVRRVEDSVRL